MNKIGLLGTICASVLTFSLSNSAVAAFVIDDFNVDSTSSVTDNVVGGPVTGPSTIDGTNIVMNGAAGWTRTLTADLTAADTMDTVVCSSCQAGHVTMGGGSSNGIGTYTYAGSAIDLSSYTLLGFDWGADLAGAGVDIIVSDGTNTSTAASWSSLAATGGSAPGDLVAQALMGIAWGSVNSSAVTGIQFVVTGVQNMDSIIDNVTAVVPVPAAVWLFGSGLLGLIGIARRKKTA
jgi:hypothetical protein